MPSTRKDGRGHWPRGKHRSPISAAEQARLLGRLRRAVREIGSKKAVARQMRVSDRTVRRWLAGEDWPLRNTCKRIGRLVG